MSELEWVFEFYRKQNAWTSAYRQQPGENEKFKTRLIENNVGAPPLQVLELGAGGGQFAVTCARAGYQVVAVELLPELADHIKELARSLPPDSLEVICGDFFSLHIEERFDTICYWDGFGIGEDREQRVLLKRIASWLKPGGLVFMDVYSPWFWARADGKKQRWGEFWRETGFDFSRCRLVDTFCHWEEKEEPFSQSLRCYTLPDLELLLEGTGLKIVSIEYQAGFDRNTGEFSYQVDFSDAIMYGVILGEDG